MLFVKIFFYFPFLILRNYTIIVYSGPNIIPSSSRTCTLIHKHLCMCFSSLSTCTHPSNLNSTHVSPTLWNRRPLPQAEAVRLLPLRYHWIYSSRSTCYNSVLIFLFFWNEFLKCRSGLFSLALEHSWEK